MSITKPVNINGNMEFPYVTDTGLVWPSGKSKRKTIDHIQIHHTVGSYGTASKWAALHKRKITDGQKGVPYGYLVTQDGQAFLGRGLEFSHGGVKDSLTTNEQGIGANQRSIAIALDGDMREPHLPTAKQLAAAVRLVQDILAYYGDVKVLGHNEIPTYSNKKPTGKTYATACPCLDMKAFRDMVKGAALPAPEPAPSTPTPATPRNIKLNDRGDNVKALQTRLNQLSPKYNCGTVDGIFGPKTNAAVRQYQEDVGLDVDGIVGPKTRAGLQI